MSVYCLQLRNFLGNNMIFPRYEDLFFKSLTMSFIEILQSNVATFMACDISQKSTMSLGQFAIVLRIVDTQMRKKEYVFCSQSLQTNMKGYFELKQNLYVYLCANYLVITATLTLRGNIEFV